VWELRISRGRLPLSGLVDLAPTLEALERAGGNASPEDFRPVLAAARAAEAVRRFLEATESRALSARRDALPRFDALLQSARRLFDADGALRDDASPRLSELRSRLRRRRNEVATG
jgi:dsDNA-specific endonuclease/ATPase MutS2